MSNSVYVAFAILIMSLITYVIRLLPLTFFRKKITNPYVKSFLNFVPYSVLGAMTFPDVIYSTGSKISAVIGVAVALILSLKNKGLLTVSLVSCLFVLICDLVISFL